MRHSRVPLTPELKEVLEVAYVSRIMSKNFRKEGQPEKERIARITGMDLDKVSVCFDTNDLSYKISTKICMHVAILHVASCAMHVAILHVASCAMHVAILHVASCAMHVAILHVASCAMHVAILHVASCAMHVAILHVASCAMHVAILHVASDLGHVYMYTCLAQWVSLHNI